MSLVSFLLAPAEETRNWILPWMVELKAPCEKCYYASAWRALPSSQYAIGFQWHKEYLLIGSNLIRLQRNRPNQPPSAVPSSKLFTNIYHLTASEKTTLISAVLCFRNAFDATVMPENDVKWKRHNLILI